MNKSNPLVSVVLTSYNQPELLERAFNSLINQIYKEIEIIIVDDCSTNKSNKKLIEKYKALYPEKVTAFYQQKNMGIPANKNTGFRLAKGDYITYLDGDDTYYENKIASEIETFMTHPDVDVVYSNFDIKSLDDKVLSVWSKNKRPEGYIFKDIILHNFPDSHTHRCELFKRNVLYDLKFYNEEYSVYHDLDFMLRYSLKYRVAYNNQIASSYYKNPESIVSNLTGLQLIEQQEQVLTVYFDEVKKNNIEKPFRKLLKNIEFDKLFYLQKPAFNKFFKAFLYNPLKLFKLLRIANYRYKTKSINIS